MTIKVGDRIPSTTLEYMSADGPVKISSDELFAGELGRHAVRQRLGHAVCEHSEHDPLVVALKHYPGVVMTPRV